MLPWNKKALSRFVRPKPKGSFYEDYEPVKQAWDKHRLTSDRFPEEGEEDLLEALSSFRHGPSSHHPIVRYGFRSKKELDRAIDSLSFTRRAGRKKDWQINGELSVGRYFHPDTRKWELMVWGKDLAEPVFEETLQACIDNKGTEIDSRLPISADQEGYIEPGLQLSATSSLYTPHFTIGDVRLEPASRSEKLLAGKPGKSITVDEEEIGFFFIHGPKKHTEDSLEFLDFLMKTGPHRKFWLNYQAQDPVIRLVCLKDKEFDRYRIERDPESLLNRMITRLESPKNPYPMEGHSLALHYAWTAARGSDAKEEREFFPYCVGFAYVHEMERVYHLGPGSRIKLWESY
jgi:hypothetical protein